MEAGPKAGKSTTLAGEDEAWTENGERVLRVWSFSDVEKQVDRKTHIIFVSQCSRSPKFFKVWCCLCIAVCLVVYANDIVSIGMAEYRVQRKKKIGRFK